MKIKLFLMLIAALAVGVACSKNSASISSSKAPQGSLAQSPATQVNGEIHYKVPEGWQTEKPSSNMRVAEYKLPKVAGDNADALLVLYYFGQGQGGSTTANIDRWINQMQQPDGQPSKDRAKTENFTVNNLPVTTVDVLGTYNGGMTPMGPNTPAAPPADMSNYRLRAAVIETPKGSYFVKLTGPQKTVERWDQAYNEYIKSFEFK